MRYLFSILIVLIPACRLSLACGPYDRSYTPDEYHTFRICGENMSGDNIKGWRYSWRENPQMDNCRSWAKITSTDIPLKDIQEVVYHWGYDRLEKLHADAVAGKKKNDNAFANWLIREKDTEITSFLLLAKKCEQTREKQCSQWYYPAWGDEEKTLLMEIVEKAKEYKGERLFDRYTLQMMRALFSLRQYNECLSIWLSRKNSFHRDVIEEMAKNYAAGACYHIGEIAKAKKMFIETGDIISYVFCINKEGKTYDSYDMLPIIYQRDTNDKRLFQQMQNIIHYDIEWGRPNLEKNLKTLYDFTLNVLDEGKAKNLAGWYYTASYLSDKLCDTVQALEYIRQARELPAGQDLKDAIRVFDIYLKAKSATKYDTDFENYLYDELSWLDQKIVMNLDSVTKKRIIRYGITYRNFGHSLYYWDDMMRKILLSQVVPKCIASGYQVRALQLLNMADNRLLNLVGKVYDYSTDSIMEWGNFQRICCSYRSRWRLDYLPYNDYDYGNDFFINLDSLGVQHIERLVVRMQKPLCDFDRFLTERSYVNMEYFYEIIGTQLLAAMRYEEAIHYLNQVSNEFMHTTNVSLYYKTKPKYYYTTEPKDYKLNFAKKMYALEENIRRLRNPDDRAECMLAYAKELQNSIGPHWYLTRYYSGHWYDYPFYSQYQTDLYDNVVKEFEYIKWKAFKTFTDAERAAKACYDWSLYKTAVTKYPQTKTAEYIRGHCDVLADYKDAPDKELYKYFKQR